MTLDGSPPSASAEDAIPIRVDPRGDVPIYLQIKYQLSYLITTEKLLPGTRLPAVRSLAGDLGINPHTVAQAYRELQSEGMIESTTGRGSFVRKFGDLDRVETGRHERLNAVLQEARMKGRALGFSESEIVQRLASLAQQQPVPCSVAYVDRVPQIAVKYARLVEQYMAGAVSTTALPLSEVESGSPLAQEQLREVFYVLTLARNAPALEEALRRYDHQLEIVTIVSEVLPSTTSALAGLPSDTRAVLLAEEHYVYNSLNLVATYSSLAPERIPTFTPADVDRFLAAAADAEVILHTFGVIHLLDELDLPARGIDARRLELAFDVSPESVAKLRRLFGVAAGGRGDGKG